MGLRKPVKGDSGGVTEDRVIELIDTAVGLSEDKVLKTVTSKGYLTETETKFLIGESGHLTEAEVNNLVAGCSKVQSGTYTGTGTYGEANPCSLDLDFTPKFVFIFQDEPYEGQCPYGMFLNPRTQAYVNNESATSSLINITWGEKSVSWYNTSYARNQFNSTTVYSWIAFGG